MTFRAILTNVSSQCSRRMGQFFFGCTAQTPRLADKVSNCGIGVLQKWGNLETVRYPAWKGPKGVANSKASEMYETAYAAETRRRIDCAMKAKNK